MSPSVSNLAGKERQLSGSRQASVDCRLCQSSGANIFLRPFERRQIRCKQVRSLSALQEGCDASCAQVLLARINNIGTSAKRKQGANEMVEPLRKQGCELTCEGSFSELHGIKSEESSGDGSVNATQKGLLNEIIWTAGVTDCNPNWTPALTAPLGSDCSSEPVDDTWNCCSITGALLRLTTNICLD